VEQFKYLGTTLTNQNCIYEKIKSRLKSGNACYQSVFLYDCESWSLTLKEDCRLGVSGNRVLTRIFGPKRDEEAREWKRLYNKDIYDLYFSTRWKKYVACMEERRGACRALMGKPEGREHLKDPGVDGRIILKWIFERSDGGL
jgi:hypothetical protein